MRQFYEMVKHTQTICRQIDDELLECVWQFLCDWRLKDKNMNIIFAESTIFCGIQFSMFA